MPNLKIRAPLKSFLACILVVGLLMLASGVLFRVTPDPSQAIQREFQPKAPQFPASKAVFSPDGSFRAQVFCNYSRADDGKVNTFWWDLNFFVPRGQRDIWGPRLADGKLALINQSPNVLYTLSWKKPGQVIAFQSSTGTKGRAVRFGKRFFLFPPRPTYINGAPHPLTRSLQRRLKKIGLTSNRIHQLRYIILQGNCTGKNTTDLVNLNSSLLLVIRNDFVSKAPLLSRGPILCVDHSQPTYLVSSDWIFMDDYSNLGLGYASAPQLIASKNANVTRARFLPDDISFLILQ